MKVRDSLLRLEQSKVIREKQESYELDRMALDAALLTAHHHKTALAYVSLALLVIAAVVGAIYVGNRRTRRLQKELLLQTKHAHESELKKAAFVNSVCHEVRTPLNCIMGFSELLCAEEITPESRAQYCEIIRDNRRQLRFLFDDMLEVAYLENLHAPLPCQYTNLCAVCQAQLRIMKVRYPKPGIVYKGAIPVAEIALNTSDKYLTILISALLGNAYKFTQEGTISLECDRLGDDRVFVAVADTAAAPAREARLCLRAFHQTRPLQPGQRPRALPLPPDRHPPARGDIHRLRIHGRDAHRRHPAAQVTPPASAAPHPLPGRAGHPSRLAVFFRRLSAPPPFCRIPGPLIPRFHSPPFLTIPPARPGSIPAIPSLPAPHPAPNLSVRPRHPPHALSEMKSRLSGFVTARSA